MNEAFKASDASPLLQAYKIREIAKTKKSKLIFIIYFEVVKLELQYLHS